MRIAYVDDDPFLLMVAQSCLERTGEHAVTCIESPHAAVDRVSEEAPDLIVLDYVMPGLDGVSLMRILRNQAALADTPIVLMSANADPGQRQYYFDAGADGVVSKPFSPASLADELTAIAAEHRRKRRA